MNVPICLDMHNRPPLFRFFQEHFAEWQVLLLTDDKTWSETVRLQTDGNPDWCFHELYQGEARGGFVVPVHKPPGAGWPDYLAQARGHLALGDERRRKVSAWS